MHTFVASAIDAGSFSSMAPSHQFIEEIVPEEQRKATRKVLKVKAILAMTGEESIAAHTVDVGTTGVSIAISHPLAAGQHGQVAFSMFFGGKVHPINALVKVVHCVFSGNEFKVGFVFTQLDSIGAASIAQFFL